jgi:hypothetical protein
VPPSALQVVLKVVKSGAAVAAVTRAITRAVTAVIAATVGTRAEALGLPHHVHIKGAIFAALCKAANSRGEVQRGMGEECEKRG